MNLLDLFCGAGGAAVGYHRAGFDSIVGIDNRPQPNYPFSFIQADALVPPVDLDAFDLIHASPPCQHFTAYRRKRSVGEGIEDRYDDHLPGTRALLAGYPHIIENVPGSVRQDLELCGSMFGLDVRRHRWFEYGGGVPAPVLVPPHNHLLPRRFRPSTGRVDLRRTIEIGAWNEPLKLQKRSMGVDWDLTLRELSEAIPPAFTEYIGLAFLEALRRSLPRWPRPRR